MKCPICNIKEHAQLDSESIIFACGNISTSEVFSDTCKYKIDWDSILISYGEEFDNSAKLVDERFFGWLELQFYKSHHQDGWYNYNIGKSCTDQEFLDAYFSGKELYLKLVKETNSLYLIPADKIIEKEYVGDFWLGKVSVQEIHNSIENGVETILYKVVAAEDSNDLIGGYVVETNPIGGGDEGKYFYDRKILDIIIRKERT